jgi:hypothetical protein
MKEKGVFYGDKGDEMDESLLCGLSGLCVENHSPKDAKLQRGAKERRTRSLPLAVLTGSARGLNPYYMRATDTDL